MKYCVKSIKKGNFCIVVGVERNVVEKVKLPIRNWGVAGIGVAGLNTSLVTTAAPLLFFFFSFCFSVFLCRLYFPFSLLSCSVFVFFFSYPVILLPLRPAGPAPKAARKVHRPKRNPTLC